LSAAPRKKTPTHGVPPAPAADDPRLACLIHYLDPTPRGLRACRQLKIRTVGDFLSHDRSAFLALRNCGERTYKDLLDRVHRLLTNQEPARVVPNTDHMQKQLRDLVVNPRALRAFQKLGVATIGEFLATPKEKLLEIPGFGERTYWQVTERIRAVTGREQPGRQLLPDALLDFSLSGLALSTKLRVRLAQLGIETLRNLFDVPIEALVQGHGIGEVGLEELRLGLDNLVRVGTERTVDLPDADKAEAFVRFMARLLSVLDADQQQLFRQRIGLECPPRRLRDVAQDLRITTDHARALEQDTLLALRQRAPGLLARIHEEAEKEHRAFEGMVRGDQLAAGTILHDAAKSTGDKLLPLRLVLFCFPQEYFLYGELLTKIPPRTWRRFRAVLKRYCNPKLLPVPLYEVELHVEAIVDPVPRELVLYLLKERHHLAISIDPKKGEVLERVQDSVADRLHAILKDTGGPLNREDLLFTYRDRHGRARMEQLRDSLRKDDRFMEIGRQLWCLRQNYEAELDMSASEADRIAREIVTDGGRHSMLRIGEREGLSERAVYMIIDCLRRNTSLRYLGRGEFCPATVNMSAVQTKITQDFRRAMGEVVLSRFLQNQKPERRRLVARLLRENRMFIEPCNDRIDLLTNYPFNEERMRRMLATVGRYLDQRNGYAPAADLVAHINTTDLGGTWLTEHLFLDLLHRNARFELLPGGLVAQHSLGLAGWIQHRAREALRYVGAPLTVNEVIAENPELAKFEACLYELLQTDPMVTGDGLRFVVV
jgi:hypothetical protein